MGKLVPIILIALGLGGGVGAGLALRPDTTEVVADPCSEPGMKESSAAASEAAVEAPTDADFVKLNNQFVVPIVGEGQVVALVVLSLSLQIAPGTQEAVFQREPKIRDAFLQVLFDHANNGGFDGAFTTSPNLNRLRLALLEAARKTLGPIAQDVLISDMVRQDA